MNKHLPYNILLVIAVAAAGIIAVCNLALRQSWFAVTVGYTLPQPPSQTSEASAVDTPVLGREEPDTAAQPPQEQEPSRAAQPEPEDSGADTVYSVQFPLELNSATLQQLMFIPQVGNVTAQRIVQYREYLGGYTSLEQLMEIKGIGAKSYENITAYLYLDEEDASPPDELFSEALEEDEE